MAGVRGQSPGLTEPQQREFKRARIPAESVLRKLIHQNRATCKASRCAPLRFNKGWNCPRMWRAPAPGHSRRRLPSDPCVAWTSSIVTRSCVRPRRECVATARMHENIRPGAGGVMARFRLACSSAPIFGSSPMALSAPRPMSQSASRSQRMLSFPAPPWMSSCPSPPSIVSVLSRREADCGCGALNQAVETRSADVIEVLDADHVSIVLNRSRFVHLHPAGSPVPPHQDHECPEGRPSPARLSGSDRRDRHRRRQSNCPRHPA